MQNLLKTYMKKSENLIEVVIYMYIFASVQGANLELHKNNSIFIYAFTEFWIISTK